MSGGARVGVTRLWDLPVRIIHWSFVALIPALWWTAEEKMMTWHMRLGTVLFALLIFRVLWGFFGSSTARFASFVKGPGAVLRYFAAMGRRKSGGSHAATIGHNPAGGWSVVALLGLMSLQVGLGMIGGDADDGSAGPLNHLVGFELAYDATEWHTEIVFNLILAFIGLHLAAILFYRLILRDNLIAPMITGSRPAHGIATVAGMVPVPAWRAVACAVIAVGAAVTVWVV